MTKQISIIRLIKSDSLFIWLSKRPRLTFRRGQYRTWIRFLWLNIDIQNSVFRLYLEQKLPNWYLYLKYSKMAIDEEVSNACICSDPMNGCPGDFAEDSHRHQERLGYKIMQFKALANTLMLKLANWYLKRYSIRAWKSYETLPWNE